MSFRVERRLPLDHFKKQHFSEGKVPLGKFNLSIKKKRFTAGLITRRKILLLPVFR